MDKKQIIQDKTENEKEKRELDKVNLENNKDKKIIQIEESDWCQTIQYYYYSFLDEKEQLLKKDFVWNTLDDIEKYNINNLLK